MFVDARSLPSGTVVDTEICIVGAGAAGITLARSLRSAAFRVAVIESGDIEGDQRTQALYGGKIVGVRCEDLDISRLRFFGGTTNHWAGWCRPFDAVDFEPRDGLPLSGWPITRSTLDSYYAAAQEVCQLGPPIYDDVRHWSREARLPVLELDGARLRTAVFQVSPPTRFGETYREDLEQARNVTVYLNANALELEANPAASEVSSLRVGCLDGPRLAVNAKYYVLATGGLENARLLLLSNRVQKAGLGNAHDTVGRYFMDHPWIGHAATLRFATPDAAVGLYYPHVEVGDQRFFASILPSQESLRREGIGNFRVVMRPTRRILEGVDSFKSVVGDITSGSLPNDLGYHIGRIVEDIDSIAAGAYKTLLSKRTSPFDTPPPQKGPFVGAAIDVNIEQMPDAASRVTLSRDIDELGQRRLAVDWRPGDREKRTFDRALQLLAAEFGRLGLGRVRYTPLTGTPGWPVVLDASRHHLGTTRMSADPKTGVVDGNCLVHGIANLYIAGSSVFPTSGCANPTLTIVAMALRLGDELRRRMA